MSPYLRLAPTVLVGSRVARKYDLLLLGGNIRFVPIMCFEEAFDTIRCVLLTARSEYKLNSKPRTYATSINGVFWSVCLWKITSMFPIHSIFIFRWSLIVIVSRPDGGGLKLYNVILSCVM